MLDPDTFLTTLSVMTGIVNLKYQKRAAWS